MLKELLRLKEPFYIVRHEKAPLLQERETFLKHLLEQGTSLASARCVAWQLLNVIRLLKLTCLRDVWIDEVENAARIWQQQQRSNPLARSNKHSASYFSYVAKKWLRFADMLKFPAVPRPRFADEVDEFARWMTEERGLSALIRDYLGHASVSTTSRYIRTNLRMKNDALEAFWKRAGLPTGSNRKWHPSPTPRHRLLTVTRRPRSYDA